MKFIVLGLLLVSVTSLKNKNVIFKSFQVGQTVKLECADNEDFEEARIWTKYDINLAVGNPIQFSETEKYVTEDQSRTLLIKNTDESDTGNYICQLAYNSDYKREYKLFLVSTEYKCDNPKAPINTDFVILDEKNSPKDHQTRSLDLGDRINYSCQDGYTLVGASSIICTKNGWSDSVPHCETEFVVQLKRRIESLEVQLSTALSQYYQTWYVSDVKAFFNHTNIVKNRWEETLDSDLGYISEKDGYLVSTFTWIVDDFEGKVLSLKAKEVEFFESKPFYTSVPGYRMRLQFSVDSVNQTHIGIYMALIQGKFDHLVSWPFTNRYDLIVVSKNEPVYDDSVFPAKSESNKEIFMRPPVNNTDGWGYAEHTQIETILENKDSYLKDEALTIKIEVYLNHH